MDLSTNLRTLVNDILYNFQRLVKRKIPFSENYHSGQITHIENQQRYGDRSVGWRKKGLSQNQRTNFLDTTSFVESCQLVVGNAGKFCRARVAPDTLGQVVLH